VPNGTQIMKQSLAYIHKVGTFLLSVNLNFRTCMLLCGRGHEISRKKNSAGRVFHSFVGQKSCVQASGRVRSLDFQHAHETRARVRREFAQVHV
jgi:hypothetical protein